MASPSGKPEARFEGGEPDRAPNLRARAATDAAGGPAELHRLLVESVHDYAIVSLDRAGHVLTWNHGAERITGWQSVEAVGRQFSVFYLPEDVTAGRPDRELREVLAQGSAELEGWRVRKDGGRYWAHVIMSVLRDDAGDLVGYSMVARDLTDRREADARLRESEQRFRLLVQSVKDYAIFMLDPEGRIATWNEGAQGIKGYTAQEIIGRHFSVFYPNEAVESRFPQYELEVAARVGSFEDEGVRVRKDGSRFWASVVITALRDPSGRLVGFAKVTRDLTERKQAQERALADARRVAEMEAASRAKSEFLATLSHELRTPLNAIGGYAELLTMDVAGTLTELQQQYLERIRTSQRHMLVLVNDLLEASRAEAGPPLQFRLEPLEAYEILAAVEAMVLPQAQSKGQVLELSDCPPEAVVWADAGRAQQIVLNLLSNAVKFTPVGGHITMGCELDGDAVRIIVADTGPGIPEQNQAAIFEPFVQLGRSLTSLHEGIGLGLSISRDLARAMAGDLTVRSCPGEGAVFTLTLPRAPRDG